jgi:hypothetical protein
VIFSSPQPPWQHRWQQVANFSSELGASLMIVAIMHVV